LLCCPGGAARCSVAVVIVVPFVERVASDPEFRVILVVEVPPAAVCLAGDAAAVFPVHSCPVLPDPFVITRLWFDLLLVNSGIESAVVVVLFPLAKFVAADPEFRPVYVVPVDPAAVAF